MNERPEFPGSEGSEEEIWDFGVAFVRGYFSKLQKDYEQLESKFELQANSEGRQLTTRERVQLAMHAELLMVLARFEEQLTEVE